MKFSEILNKRLLSEEISDLVGSLLDSKIDADTFTTNLRKDVTTEHGAFGALQKRMTDDPEYYRKWKDIYKKAVSDLDKKFSSVNIKSHANPAWIE